MMSQSGHMCVNEVTMLSSKLMHHCFEASCMMPSCLASLGHHAALRRQDRAAIAAAAFGDEEVHPGAAGRAAGGAGRRARQARCGQGVQQLR